MKRIRFVSTGVLLLLFGITTLPYAKQPQDKDKQQEKDKPQQNQNRQQQQQRGQQQQQVPRQQQQQQGQIRQVPRQDQQQPDQGQRQQQGRGQQPQQVPRQQQPQQGQIRQQQVPRQQQAGRPSQQGQRGQRGQQREVWQEHRARTWQAEHRTWQQRGGYNGYRIPEDRYRGYFGRDHAFRIYRYPVVVVGGYPRFQYGGFWFSVLDPWPEYWSDNWYDDDDVYIDYSGDGYYLYNRRYPQDRIAISVSLN
jgi:hypothetical protein